MVFDHGILTTYGQTVTDNIFFTTIGSLVSAIDEDCTMTDDVESVTMIATTKKVGELSEIGDFRRSVTEKPAASIRVKRISPRVDKNGNLHERISTDGHISSVED